MLKPALLYKKELQDKHVGAWYEPGTFYYNGLTCNTLKIDDNNESQRQFASVDKDGNVIGFISYNIDWATRGAYRLGIISYDKGNIEFIRDIYRTIYQIFCQDNFDRLEWFCFANNHASKAYKRFIEKFGGRIAGYLHRTNIMPDGKYVDSYIFEILKEDFNFDAFKKRAKRIGAI